MKKIAILPLLVTSVLVACNTGNKNPDDTKPKKEITLVDETKERIKDKVLGGWVGHNIGMGSGYEYVVATNNWCDLGPIEGITVGDKTAIIALDDKYWEPNGKICSGSIGINELNLRPINDPRVVKGIVYSDDDVHVDLLNQFIFRDYGPVLGNNDITQAWDFYDVHDVGGGEPASSLIKNSYYTAPFCGSPTYGNTGYWVTESWIENETLGLTFPYMYDTALAYADMFTQVQGDAYCYYLGKLSAMMHAFAFEYSDAPTCLAKAFDFIPHNNDLWKQYQTVLKYKKNNIPWRDCARKLVEDSVNCSKIGIADVAGFSITANAGMIFLGIVYGENDYEESIKITSLAGLDGDCTAATVGSLLGACLGYSGTPQKYRDYLGPNSIYYNHTGANGYATGVNWGAFAYMGAHFPNSLTFDQIADLFVDNIEAQIVHNGGSISETGYKIPHQGYHPVDQVETTNFSFEDGATTGWEYSSSNPETTFSASKTAAHLGEYGGLIVIPDTKDTAKAYQQVKVKKGNTYKATIWVNKCNDREFKFFASDLDGNNLQFHSCVNSVLQSRYHMKAELYFTATSKDMIVGIEYGETYEEAYSTTLAFDDLIIADVTRTVTNRDYHSYEAENLTLLESAEKVKNDKFSGKTGVLLQSDDGIKLNFTAKGEVQSFRFFYENTDTLTGLISFKVDGRQVCVIPLVSTGVNSSYNKSNYTKADLYFAPGEHELEIDYVSFAELTLDKIEIVNANDLLEW